MDIESQGRLRCRKYERYIMPVVGNFKHAPRAQLGTHTGQVYGVNDGMWPETELGGSCLSLYTP